MKKFLLIILFVNITLFSNTSSDSSRIYGISIDGIFPLNSIVDAISRHSRKMTTRIVFDEGVPATTYVLPCQQIHQVSNVMGELVDSYVFSRYSFQQYHDRVNEYLNALGNTVDIWEIGNEVNGEWLGNIDSVVAKISDAYNIVKGQNKVTELTLYYNYQCWENQSNEMFRWVNQRLPANMKNGLDYVLVSYYEDDCNGYQPNWQSVFDSLHVLFPNSKLGIGECGTSIQSKKAAYINKYYKINVTTPNFVGGYFWWYYREDCVPYTSPLWQVLDAAIAPGNGNINYQDKNIKVYLNFSPYNPIGQITFYINKDTSLKIKIYNSIGREVKTLLDGFKEAGEYSMTFDERNLASGIYFFQLTSDGDVYSQKFVVLK